MSAQPLPAVAITLLHETAREHAEQLAQRLQLPLTTVDEVLQNFDFQLVVGDNGLGLTSADDDPINAVRVDFVTGAAAHRRKYGGGKGQDIAKAVGIKAQQTPSVLDVTAGFGRDAFVLATLGCEVTLLERHPLVFCLLEDALQRARDHAAKEDSELLEIIERMHYLNSDSATYLQQHRIEQQVIYIDPMFPERKKSAAVKKEMVLLQQLLEHSVGQVDSQEENGDDLLLLALQQDVHRVVVKRPKLAGHLAGREPGLMFKGKSGRFDVYPKKAMPKKGYT